jgi:hypothetical protein
VRSHIHPEVADGDGPLGVRLTATEVRARHSDHPRHATGLRVHHDPLPLVELIPERVASGVAGIVKAEIAVARDGTDGVAGFI